MVGAVVSPPPPPPPPPEDGTVKAALVEFEPPANALVAASTMPEPVAFAVRVTWPPAVPPKVTGMLQLAPLPVGVPTVAVAPPLALAVNEAAVTPVTDSLKFTAKL